MSIDLCVRDCVFVYVRLCIMYKHEYEYMCMNMNIWECKGILNVYTSECEFVSVCGVNK